MTEYVAGFLFSTSMGQLVLVEKQRPEWQAGKCNGVGGKIEAGETPHDAMAREFREETGKDVPMWSRFCTLECPNARVYFFYAIAEDYNKVESTTDEEILLWDVDYAMDLRRPIIPNLRWLIQMARSLNAGETAHEFVVTEVHLPTNPIEPGEHVDETTDKA